MTGRSLRAGHSRAPGRLKVSPIDEWLPAVFCCVAAFDGSCLRRLLLEAAMIFDLEEGDVVCFCNVSCHGTGGQAVKVILTRRSVT